jgi:hypothetical protein
MGNNSKSLVVLFFVLFSLLSVVLVKPVNSQVGVTIPSLPSFSVGYDESENYVSPSYGVDSTGKAIVVHEGYYKVSRWTYVSIANQPFEPYTDSKGNYIQLFYDVRWKANGSQSWQGLDVYRFTQVLDFHITRILIGFKGYEGAMGVRLLDYVPDAQIDFQVQALIGYYTADNVFVGKSSGWCDTQTLTIPNNSSATNPISSPSPSVPELSPVTVLSVVFLVTVVLLIMVKGAQIRGGCGWPLSRSCRRGFVTLT